MTVEEFGDRRFDERCGKPRKNRGEPAQDALIEDGILGEVSDLSRTADVSGGGQNLILKDGPQKRGGRDALRLALQNAEQLIGGVVLAACLPEAAGLAGGCGGALERAMRAPLRSSIRKSRLPRSATATWAV